MALTLQRRRMYFLAAVIAFCVATPILIAYSLGYRLADGLTISKTGGIFINAQPKGTAITVDGVVVGHTSTLPLTQGKLISGLLPGEHTVLVTKDGYLSWEKILTVTEGLVSEARNVALVPQNTVMRALAEKTYDFIFSDSGALVAYATQNSIGIFDTTRNHEIVIPLDKNERVGSMRFGSDENYLVIESFLKNKTRRYLVHIPTQTTTDIRENETEKFVKVRQYSQGQPRFIALTVQHALISADISSQQEPRIIAKNVAAFELFGDTVMYATTEPSILYEKNLTTDQTDQLTQTPLADIGVSSTLLRSRGGYTAFINDKNELYAYDTEMREFKRVAEAVIGATFADDGKKLAWQNKNEIYVRYLRDILIQPRRMAGETELITRFSTPIAGIAWFSYDNEHIMFVAEQQLKFTELDGRDRRNTHDVAEMKTPLKMQYNSYDDTLYLLDGTTLKRISLFKEE